MAEILNLNKARKVKARAQDREKAAINRAAHGRTRQDKALEAARQAKATQALDQAKREP